MKSISELSIENLNSLVKVFEELGIRYSLYGGNLIGAFRDGGFCLGNDGSKDDDIDLLIPYEDFSKIESGFNEGKFPSYFRLSGFRIYDLRYSVDEGLSPRKPLFIDIFYLFRTNSDKRVKPGRYLSRALSTITANLVTEETCKISISYLKEMAKYMIDESGDTVITSADWEKIPEYGIPVFGSRMVEFEGHNYRVIDNAEDYLDAHYDGKWMERPDHCGGHNLVLINESYKF